MRVRAAEIGILEIGPFEVARASTGQGCPWRPVTLRLAAATLSPSGSGVFLGDLA